MSKVTKKDVIEYFKDAKLIHHPKAIFGTFSSYNFDIKTLREHGGSFYTRVSNGMYGSNNVVIYDIKTNTFATIVTYKEGIPSKPTRYSSREVNGMDVIDLIKHWDLNFNEGNILKYLLRKKGEDASDMKKIVDYANREEDYLNKK